MMPTDGMQNRISQGLSLRRSDPEHIQEVQLNCLKNHLRHAQNSLFYKNLLVNSHFEVDDLKTVGDLGSIPFTSRNDLAEFHRNFTTNHAPISDISYTSGTTGTPLVIPYTAADLNRLAFNEAMAFYSAGVTAKDKILLTVTLDRGFIAGIAYYTGIQVLGATAIRSGPGHLEHQWKLIQELSPTVLLGVPSFLLAMARWGKKNGFLTTETSIHTLILIGEPVQDGRFSDTTLGKLLKESWNAQLISSYGATEIETAFGDCKLNRGGHEHPELMFVEIIDDEGKLVSDGVAGEVVVTPLGVQGLPLIRYKTGDISRLHSSPCKCGFNTRRLGPVEGRLSQRLKFKGTTLYPEMILQALQQLSGLGEHYIEVHEAFDLSDKIIITVATTLQCPTPTEVKNHLSSLLRVTPEIQFKPLNDVEKITGIGKLRKPKRFFDLRKNQKIAGS